MPSRPEQCVYKEAGRRCTKNGTGEPPMCRAHAIAYEDAMLRATSPLAGFGSGISAAVSDFVTRGKISRAKADAALADVAAAMMGVLGGLAQQASSTSSSGRFDPPPGFRPPPGWRPRQAPQIDPQVVARARAKQVMGFAPNEAVTAEMVKVRKRELAKRHHPDAGGDPSKMAAVNNAADILLAGL